MLVQKKDIIYGHILGYISIYLEYMGLKIKMGKEFSIKSKEILLGVEAENTRKDIDSNGGANHSQEIIVENTDKGDEIHGTHALVRILE